MGLDADWQTVPWTSFCFCGLPIASHAMETKRVTAPMPKRRIHHLLRSGHRHDTSARAI